MKKKKQGRETLIKRSLEIAGDPIVCLVFTQAPVCVVGRSTQLSTFVGPTPEIHQGIGDNNNDP